MHASSKHRDARHCNLSPAVNLWESTLTLICAQMHQSHATELRKSRQNRKYCIVFDNTELTAQHQGENGRLSPTRQISAQVSVGFACSGSFFILHKSGKKEEEKVRVRGILVSIPRSKDLNIDTVSKL